MSVTILECMNYKLNCIEFFLQSPFGDPVEPSEAPESISKAVASLPPEQMFELMKQMKVGHLVISHCWHSAYHEFMILSFVTTDVHPKQPK